MASGIYQKKSERIHGVKNKENGVYMRGWEEDRQNTQTAKKSASEF